MSKKAKTAPPAPRPMPRGYGLALLALNLAAAGVSGYLAYVHLRLHRDPGFESLCALGSRFSCDAVAVSGYADVWGFPIASMGLWFYLSASVVTLLGLRRTGFPRSAAALLFAEGVFAILLSVALAILSAVALDAVCPFCLVLYGLNLAILVFAWLAVRGTGERPVQALAWELSYWQPRQGRATLLVGIPLVALIVMYGAWPKGYAEVADICQVAAAPRGDKPIEVVIYSDFECPYCAVADRALREVRSSPKVHIDHRQFPLDKDCNPVLKNQMHAGACLMAQAAVCAGQQGKYDPYSDYLFDQKSKPRTASDLTAAAVSLGLDKAAFEKCLGSPEAKRKVDEDIRAGMAAGVSGTPSIYVNGRPFKGPLNARNVACLKGP